MTDVVAALIWDNERFLACQRPAHKARGLLWEFVGGKVEPGETKEQALIRECREELDITVSVGEIFMEVVHEYPDLTIRLTLYNAGIAEGIPQALEHHDLKWITTSEIDLYDFCPADEEILVRLKTIRNGVHAGLYRLQDSSYKEFQCKLMPTVDPDKVLGVRMPQLRKFAKQFEKIYDTESFLNTLPHEFYEEDNIHGILISGMRDYDQTIAALDRFLPYVDNWATCDLLSPESFRSHPAELIPQVKEWLSSGKVYTCRFAVGVLMKYYLDDAFLPDYPLLVASIQTDEYYLRMMIAWYFATALAKRYDFVIQYLENPILDTWTHNQTIRKAIESYRISDEKKAYLRTLKLYEKEGKNHEKN